MGGSLGRYDILYPAPFGRWLVDLYLEDTRHYVRYPQKRGGRRIFPLIWDLGFRARV